MLCLAAGVRVHEEEGPLLQDQAIDEDDEFIQPIQIDTDHKTEEVLETWQVNPPGVDHAVRILSGAQSCRHLWYILINLLRDILSE